MYVEKIVSQLKCGTTNGATKNIQDFWWLQQVMKGCQKPGSMPLYTEFCDKIIRAQLIKKQEIFRMKKLSSLFQKMIREHHGHGSYRSDLLKKRLRQDFPQLNFYKPLRKNLSEMVFTEATGLLNKGSSTETESSGSQDTLSSGGETVQEGRTYAAQRDHTRTIYSAGIILKQAVKSAPKMSANWPPTSEDLNISSARKIVPIELYNLLAWCIGVSDELTLSNMVNVSEEVDLRLLSICQDIIYLSSKGRNQTPKSLTLGLTLHHLTGSFQVVHMVSKLGHCVSWESVVGFETSLAQLQLSRGLDLPQGFASNNFTVLVWDNVDFGEETSSGKGTTHHTIFYCNSEVVTT
ncbi:uncharacterized protein LOC118560224 [Fundulus heteroclitus]|uniref:uncharacterized protein LOC118560224 n=1 Tax=Fundulus heteroclitus TaxID=8078 RepID=UPI00165AFCDA|nr:uncharacterized protein LOC118560224 [Fundulus heteroclitus]